MGRFDLTSVGGGGGGGGSGSGGGDFCEIPDRHKRMTKSSSTLVVPSVIHRNLLILMCIVTLPTTMITGYSFLLDQHRLSRRMFWSYTVAKIAEVCNIREEEEKKKLR